MKNGLGEVQTVVLFGTSSDIGNAIVETIPKSLDSRVIRIGKNQKSDFNLEMSKQLSEDELRASLPSEDIDIAVFASGSLSANSEIPLNSSTMEMLNINFNNTLLGISIVAERMTTQGHGTIVVLSSMATARPRMSNFIYGATKTGLDFYVRGLMSLCKGTNITILLVRPGFVFTKLTASHKPAPFSISPQKLASIVSGHFFGTSKIIYTPRGLKWIYFLLKTFPSSIVFKIK